MRPQTRRRFWLILIAVLSIHVGNAAAIGTRAFASSSTGKEAVPAASELPDLNTMSTEFNNHQAF